MYFLGLEKYPSFTLKKSDRESVELKFMKNIILFLIIGNLFICHQGMSQSNVLAKDSLLVIQEGTASYYGKKFHKKRTASGEIFNMKEFTAAHKHLPFGTLLKVKNLDNGYEVIVKVNDRLPQNSRRIIDLSRTAAEQLDMVQSGLTKVKLHALSYNAIEEIKDHYVEVPDELRLRVYYEPVTWSDNGGIFSSNLLYEK